MFAGPTGSGTDILAIIGRRTVVCMLKTRLGRLMTSPCAERVSPVQIQNNY
jgi:hypothetical protein